MNLAKTQLLSLITKGITTALGIVQSVIVIRILGPAEFGLVGLVMSIGGVIGVTQHLGIVDGAIREIAVLKKKEEIGKVFWVSHLFRQAITLPLSIGLLIMAGVIATRVYERPEIIPYIQLFAGILILQGLQDVLGATLTGMKKFFLLYITQIITAGINIVAFAYLTWAFGITGFFWAMMVTTGIMIAIFLIIVTLDLRKHLKLPTLADIRYYAGRVMRIGAYMYLARIFFVLWQRMPLLVLGGLLTAEELGFFNVSLTFGSKLTIIGMALSEVNLSWMSSLFANNLYDFKKVVTRNMQRVLVLMMLLTLVLLYFAPEIIMIVGSQYLPAHTIILIMTTAFFLYALTDLGTSSVFVSADQPRTRAWIYGLMTSVTALVLGWLFFTRPDPLWAAYGVLGGAGISYLVTLWLVKSRFGITLITGQLALFMLSLALSVAWLMQNPPLGSRVVVFILLLAYVLWEIRRTDLVPVSLLAYMPFKKNTKIMEKDNQKNNIKIICFAGAEYDLGSWTNRQHVMSRVSEKYPVLYIEPRVWFLSYFWRYKTNPKKLFNWLKKLVWWEEKHNNLYVKSQWNLLPGSREVKFISAFNHLLNRWCVLLTARWLGFRQGRQCMWIYDTEAAEFLSAFKKATVMYDCVDNHAAQSGVDRNSERVREEEKMIQKRADIVTVTSRRLFKMKNNSRQVHLVLNSGDVELFQAKPDVEALDSAGNDLSLIPYPIFGTVGALDKYKVNFDLIAKVARWQPDWQFVFIGAPVVDSSSKIMRKLQELPNVHFMGAIKRQHVPAYVNQFDICMIPYNYNKYNQSSFPLKFWEFMATGKPIIATGLPELKEYNGLIGYAKGPADFMAVSEELLRNPEKNQGKRMALARQHTWDKRVEVLLNLLLAEIKNK